MSTLKVNKLRDTAGSADAITLDPNGGAVLAGVTTVSTVKVGSGVTISSDGDVFTTGITTSSTVIVGSGVTISESGIEATGVGITVANINGGQISGRRNKLINGAMAVSQRQTSRTGTGGGSDYYLCDRWRIFSDSTSARFTISQAADTSGAPGLPYSFKFDCTTADTSLAAGDYLGLQQKLEGQDVQDFLKGTSDAKEFTLSFYVKTNKSGVYTVELRDNNNSRTAAKTFTVSDGNWNRYILTFPADTTGALSNNNNDCLQINWWLIAGSTYTSGTHNTSSWTSQTNANRVSSSNVNISDSTDNNWEITGVQLEVGSQATAFEHRSFAEEKALCQRYCYQWDPDQQLGMGQVYSGSGYVILPLALPVEMRAKPSVTKNGSYWFVSYHGNSGYAGDRAVTVEGNNGTVPNGFMYRLFVNGGSNQGNAVTVWCIMHDDAGQYLRLESEL